MRGSTRHTAIGAVIQFLSARVVDAVSPYSFAPSQNWYATSFSMDSKYGNCVVRNRDETTGS